MKTTLKKAYIVPESAAMQILEQMYLMQNVSDANGAYDPNDDSDPKAPGRRKPF